MSHRHHRKRSAPSRRRVLDDVIAEASATLGLAHVVVLDDPYLDVPMVYGPFDYPSEAAAFAESLIEGLIYPGCELPPRIRVLPLRSPAHGRTMGNAAES